MDWVVYKSPLWHIDKVQDNIKPLPNRFQRTVLENNFVNDAIRTQVYHYPRKKPIIPAYTAERDKYARAYFRCPLVKNIMNSNNRSLEEAVQAASAPVSCTPRATQTDSVDLTGGRSSSTNSRFIGIPYRNKEIRTREQLKEEKNLNKLSHRHRVQKTPNVEKIRQREQKFTNDAIVTEKKRTRFKDIIPQYDASEDRHCRAYFKRKDVQQLINVTRSREENAMYDYWLKKLEIAKQYSNRGPTENGKHIEPESVVPNRVIIVY